MSDLFFIQIDFVQLALHYRRGRLPQFLVVEKPARVQVECHVMRKNHLQYAADIKTAPCPERKIGLSRNIGIEMASGDIVAFIMTMRCPSVLGSRRFHRFTKILP